ncbi:hypothetical protein YC2023_053969 [Brassica napus]
MEMAAFTFARFEDQQLYHFDHSLLILFMLNMDVPRYHDFMTKLSKFKQIINRYTAEAVNILTLLSTTYLVAFCQACESNIKKTFKAAVNQTTKRVLSVDEPFLKQNLLQVIHWEYVFSYVTQTASLAY